MGISASRFALFGAGFWARYQLAGWREAGDAECVAIYNRTRSKAGSLAAEFGVPAVYDDARLLLAEARPDFVDIVTAVETHADLVRLAVSRRTPAICQKPMARDLAEAEAMVSGAAAAGVPLYIHENWRWQAPMRRLAHEMDEGSIGRVFRGRLDFVCSFPVFDNQPFLRTLDQFIITDIGSHVLDCARFLFGEARTVTCRTTRVNCAIKGEDVATVMLGMASGATVVCNLSYASATEHERFPQTFAFIEGDGGSLELTTDYWVRVTDRHGLTRAYRAAPHRYPWADPAYDVVHASIVPCCRDLLAGLQGEYEAETTAADNLKTVRLVHAAYASAAADRTIDLAEWRPA